MRVHMMPAALHKLYNHPAAAVPDTAPLEGHDPSKKPRKPYVRNPIDSVAPALHACSRWLLRLPGQALCPRLQGQLRA